MSWGLSTGGVLRNSRIANLETDESYGAGMRFARVNRGKGPGAHSTGFNRTRPFRRIDTVHRVKLPRTEPYAVVAEL